MSALGCLGALSRQIRRPGGSAWNIVTVHEKTGRDLNGHEIHGAAAHLSAGAKYGAALLCMRGTGADANWPVMSVSNHEI